MKRIEETELQKICLQNGDKYSQRSCAGMNEIEKNSICNKYAHGFYMGVRFWESLNYSNLGSKAKKWWFNHRETLEKRSLKAAEAYMERYPILKNNKILNQALLGLAFRKGFRYREASN